MILIIYQLRSILKDLSETGDTNSVTGTDCGGTLYLFIYMCVIVCMFGLETLTVYFLPMDPEEECKIAKSKKRTKHKEGQGITGDMAAPNCGIHQTCQNTSQPVQVWTPTG